MAANQLRAAGVTVDYGRTRALNDVSLVGTAGRMLGVGGPSGAGKTTLVQVLAGLIHPAGGGVFVDEGTLRPWPDERVVIIPQTYGLVPFLTAVETVALPLQARGVRPAEARSRSLEALTRLGLGGAPDRLAGQLSGGQQQRLATARALATDSDVLLADEPTSELDADNRNLVLTLLRGEAERGRIVVITSHDPEVVVGCDDTLLLRDGNVVAT